MVYRYQKGKVNDNKTCLNRKYPGFDFMSVRRMFRQRCKPACSFLHEIKLFDR